MKGACIAFGLIIVGIAGGCASPVNCPQYGDIAAQVVFYPGSSSPDNNRDRVEISIDLEVADRALSQKSLNEQESSLFIS